MQDKLYLSKSKQVNPTHADHFILSIIFYSMVHYYPLIWEAFIILDKNWNEMKIKKVILYTKLDLGIILAIF